MSQVVVVTGGGWGLGRAIGERFGQAGGRVALSYHTSAQGAQEAAAAIESGGGEALALAVDVRDYEQVKGLVDAAYQRWGRIDVMVNNAGGQTIPWLQSSAIPLHELEAREWDYLIGINLYGTYHGIKAAAPYMIEQKEGHIINMTSGTGIRGRAGFGAYTAAKAGIIGLTKAVARELGEHNIKVNAVCPGAMPYLRPGQDPPSPAFIAESLLRRLGSAEEVAEGVYRLVQMQNVSGQTFLFENRILH